MPFADNRRLRSLLETSITHALHGAPASSGYTAADIANLALGYLVKKRPWRWRQKLMSLDFKSLTPVSLTRAANVVTAVINAHGLPVGAAFRITGSTAVTDGFDGTFTIASVVGVNSVTWSQVGAAEVATAPGTLVKGYVELPEDFAGIITINSATSSFRAVLPCSIMELSQMRQMSAGAAYQTFYAVSWLGQATTILIPTPILEIFPSPTVALVGALQGAYWRLIPKMAAGTDYPDIPADLHDLLDVLCRAMAVSLEEDVTSSEWQRFNAMFAEYAAEDGAAVGPVVGQLANTLGRGYGTSQFDPNGRITA